MSQKGPDMPANTSDTAKREEETLGFWKKHGIFEKTLAKEAPKGEFVFYDGPPFATGLPHYGSLLSSIIKDVVPRYKTMRGYHVPRRWGWDCHGLPIETLIEQRLNLKTRKDIDRIGVDVFNEAARASVMEFEHEWEHYIDRIGRFVDFKNSYKTMDNSYIESVWWTLKELHTKGLLYEGRKVLMYCPHDETPLAKAEIAMDHTYKDITEEAITVKFKVTNPEKIGLKGDVFLLTWTTTPWTLPGNVALAVGKDIDYRPILDVDKNEVLIVSDKYHTQTQNFHTTLQFPMLIADRVEALKGNELVGLQYKPLFDIPAPHSDKAYKVYAADFVSTEEGTGIVHTAVMYGEDDFALGQEKDLPMVQLLDAGAHFNDNAPEFLRGQYIKKAEKAIKEDLDKRGLLFARDMHTHSYPHCYRCGTPLIYNAVPSWFINVQRIKERMLAENEHITWVPEHLKEGRFKNIVESAPDWTISRNRFWASPLPIWKDKKNGKLMVVGSLDELKARVKKSDNRYFVMRHGGAKHMVDGVYTDDPHDLYPLTEKGIEQVTESVAQIPRGMPLVIISSPVLRARQSAEIVARELGVPKDSVVVDARLRELGFGIFDGKPKEEYQTFLERPDWYSARPQGGENFEDAKIRFGEALYEYESRYQNTLVLVVSHAIANESLMAVAEGAREDRFLRFIRGVVVGPAELNEINFTPLPVNKKFELDLHRPYTDSLILLDDEGLEYERIPEVVDCWVESGAMPQASEHYPFEHEDNFKKRFPADFIAEYIAQTRTWFYYMHALGVALFDSVAFRSVVSTGTVLAGDGSKMSKSKGNYTDPLALIDRYGADALRLYLMGSVVMQAEDVRFRDEDVRDAHNRIIGIFWNCYKFFELYRDRLQNAARVESSEHPLDRWIRSRLGELVRDTTDAMECYDTPRAVRALRLFVEDYSTWYVRRSRDRVRAESADQQLSLATQRKVLLTVATLMAPLAPFLAESVYRGVGGEKESVHLESWPEEQGVDEKIIADMGVVRSVVSHALELRDRAGVKVRQPLRVLEAQVLPEDPALHEIIAEEVNVKRVVANPNLDKEVWLDVELTAELREEGAVRDVIRAIQSRRKDEGFSINDRPPLTMNARKGNVALLRKHSEVIISQTGLSHLTIVEDEHAEPISLEFV